ncbi:ran binding protein 9 [Echinococcus multilocularis]|uniref:Ran binding protein 9 n=1 Tax=Echinococcus multilocularis TaxID=6211 RepID=A0A068Y5L1_ECHMU|nr:ran binding protein 9 [Echinococcus multilocularis]
MAEPVLRRGLELQQRVVNSLYPIAVRYNATLPKCFMQFKDYSNSPSWEETLRLKDMRSPSQKVPTVLKVVANHPIPLCCSLYYYEVSISAKSQCGSLKVGFSFDESDKAKHQRCANFVGYHSNTGQIGLNDGDSTLGDEENEVCGPPFGVGDVIGCGVNFVNNSIFFTKNGIIIGSSIVHSKLANAVTIPCVIMISPATALIANFGQRDFVFAIAQYLAQERCSSVTQAIEDKLTADLANVGMQSLVLDYLMRHGYLATASSMVRPSLVSPRPITAATAAAIPVPPSPNPPSSESANGSLARVDPGSNSTLPSIQLDAPQKRELLESSMTGTGVTPTTETVSTSLLSNEVPKSAPPREGWECGGGEKWPETPEAANRRIRLAELISQGQYLQAISQLAHDYTSLVETMPSIIFMLRCRYFIELLFTNQRPSEDVARKRTATAPTVTSTKATSAPSNSDCKNGGKMGVGTTFKRPQPSSSPECSPCGGGSCFRQSAAVRRKCEETNGSTNGIVSEDENDEDLLIECIRQENGGVTVLQAPRFVQNGVSILTKEKRKATRSLFKCSSLNSVEKPPEVPIQNGITHKSTHNSSDTPPEPSSHPIPIGETMPIQESPVVVLDLNSIVQLGRELRDKAKELQTKNALSPAQAALLQDAFSLIAYENPYESPFADLMHPRHRKILAESVNNAILVNLGKARYPLLEIGIGMLEETVLNGQGGNRLSLSLADAKALRKQHNQASTSSAGSTLTPSHTVSTSVNLPSTVGIYATATATTASSPSPRTGGSGGSGGLQQYHRGHRRHHHHHHRSATSSLVVTSTTTSATASRALNPLSFLANLPPPTVALRQRSSSSSAGRRLRNTIVQSSPRGTGEEGLQEIVVSGGGGVEWREEAAEREEEAETAAVATTTAVEEVQLVLQEGGRLHMDRYASSPPLPPPQSVDIRVGGSEMAGFFHPALFVPPSPPS